MAARPLRAVALRRGLLPAVHLRLHRPPEGRRHRHAQLARQRARHVLLLHHYKQLPPAGLAHRHGLVAAAVPRLWAHRGLPLDGDAGLPLRPPLPLHLHQAPHVLAPRHLAPPALAPRHLAVAELWLRPLHAPRKAASPRNPAALPLEGGLQRRRAHPHAHALRLRRKVRAVRMAPLLVGMPLRPRRDVCVRLRRRRASHRPRGAPLTARRGRRADAAAAGRRQPDRVPRLLRRRGGAHRAALRDLAPRDWAAAAGRSGWRGTDPRRERRPRLLAEAGAERADVPHAPRPARAALRAGGGEGRGCGRAGRRRRRRWGAASVRKGRAVPLHGRSRLCVGVAAVHRRPPQGHPLHPRPHAARARHRDVCGGGPPCDATRLLRRAAGGSAGHGAGHGRRGARSRGRAQARGGEGSRRGRRRGDRRGGSRRGSRGGGCQGVRGGAAPRAHHPQDNLGQAAPPRAPPCIRRARRRGARRCSRRRRRPQGGAGAKAARAARRRAPLLA
mmetsp:Transcript_34696/g.115944  ORF Transcript_34696/g.115944 Transcript_34696/m.115944 type:complete len:502 (-) Transcript_34696:1085-2590(-)